MPARKRPTKRRALTYRQKIYLIAGPRTVGGSLTEQREWLGWKDAHGEAFERDPESVPAPPGLERLDSTVV